MVVQNRKVERNWGSHILPSGWNKFGSFEHHSQHSYVINIFIRGHHQIIIIFLVVMIIIFRVKQVGRNTVAWVRKFDSRILSIEEDTIVQVIMQNKLGEGGGFTFVPTKLRNRDHILSIEEDTIVQVIVTWKLKQEDIEFKTWNNRPG